MDNLKEYQEFSKEEEKIYEFALKKHMNVIKHKIENNVVEGLNSFEFDFDFSNNKDMKEFDPFGVIFDIIIDFENNNKKKYYAYIQEDIIKKNNFRNFDIKIEIIDFKIDYYQLFSIITHELKHVYDLYHNNNLDSFDKVLHTNGLINFYKKNYWIHDFMQLNYLALDHEVDARIRMLYDKLYYLRTFDKSMIQDEFKKNYLYKSAMMLINFDPNNILTKVEFNELLKFTNIFIENILKKKYVIKTLDELKNFYKEIKINFENIGNKFLLNTNDIIDKFIRDNKPYSENHYLTIGYDYNNDEFNNDEYVFTELLEIYNYIKF